MKRLLLLALLGITSGYTTQLTAVTNWTHYCICNNGSLEGADCDAACAKQGSRWRGKADLTQKGVRCYCGTEETDSVTLECDSVTRCATRPIGSGWSKYVYSRNIAGAFLKAKSAPNSAIVKTTAQDATENKGQFSVKWNK
jgi:hypothetical protein